MDSFLSDERQCSLRDGLCPDEDHRPRSNNVIMVDSNRQADVSSVDFIKKRGALDELDADISLRSDTMVLVAIGSLNMPLRRVTGFEMENSFDMENGTIDFNSKVAPGLKDIKLSLVKIHHLLNYAGGLTTSSCLS